MFPSSDSKKAGESPRLQVVAPFVITASFAVSLNAQQSSVLEVEEVVVSGTRSPQSTVTVPASITVITREEIEASGAPHLVDVLRGQGAVQVFDRFGDGSRAQVGMRGFGETAHGNTLVLVDGRRLNNSDIGDPDLNSISLKDIERIEIIQGSAGALFGDQAVGGVINIITRKPRKFIVTSEAGFGSYKRLVGRFQLGNSFENGLSLRLSGEKLRTDNYRDNNEKEYDNLTGLIEFEHSQGSLFADFQRVEEILQLPGGLTEAQVAADRRQGSPFFPNDELDTDTYALRGGLRQHVYGPWSFEGEIAYREVDAEGVFFNSPFDSKRQQVEITPRFIGSIPNRFGEAVVTIGADIRDADFDLASPSVTATRNRQDVEAVYAQAVLPFAPKWSLTLGARQAWVENDLTTVDPFGGPDFPGGVILEDEVFVTEIGVTFQPTPQWRLFFRRDENFRFAKADEQSFTVPGTVGLDTQTGTSWEAGAEWSPSIGNSLKLVGFYLPIDDEIAFDPTVVGPSPFIPGANVNLDSTLRKGFILEGNWRASDRFSFAGAFTYTDAKFDSGGLDGNRVPFVAEAVARLSADIRLSEFLQGYIEIQSISDRFLIGDNSNSFPKLGGYTVLNLRLSYQYRDLTFAARVNNVTDKEYIDSGSPFSLSPAPERNFWFTARLDFN